MPINIDDKSKSNHESNSNDSDHDCQQWYIHKKLSVISNSLQSYDQEIINNKRWICHENDQSLCNFTNNFMIDKIVSSQNDDISKVTTFYPLNYDITKFELWSCQKDDNILTIGFPHEFLHDMTTADGVIPAAKVVRDFHLPYESMAIFEGTIAENKCNQENNYTIDFDCVLWSGFQGGFVVLLNEPTKLCGMFSHTRLKEDNNGYVDKHVGICSNHPLFATAQNE